jgi:hypothetical protein
MAPGADSEKEGGSAARLERLLLENAEAARQVYQVKECVGPFVFVCCFLFLCFFFFCFFLFPRALRFGFLGNCRFDDAHGALKPRSIFMSCRVQRDV